MDFPKKYEIGEKVNLYIIKNQKFKTVSLNVFIHRPLDDDATRNALIPLVLRRGSQRFKTLQEISRHLEELYGAMFDCGVAKKGERHILRFHMEAINNKKLEDAQLFYQSLDFLSEIIFSPLVENNQFKEDYVSQEKDNLRKIIEGRLNEKMKYAMERCIEEMCKDEPYSIYEYGNINDLEGIDGKNLYDYYIRMVSSSPIDIFISGDVNEDIIEKVKKRFSPPRQNIVDIQKTKVEKHIENVRKIEDKMDVSQGKLCIGFRTNTPYDTDDYYPLILYSGILGGSAVAKLFMNVREKASLAYTISSRIDKFKGLMFILAGIDFGNYQKTLDITFEQLEEIKKGNITDEEYNASLKGITTSIKSLADTHLYIVDFFLSQLISGSSHTFEELIDKFNAVKKEEIPKVAGNIELDTIYFLNKKS